VNLTPNPFPAREGEQRFTVLQVTGSARDSYLYSPSLAGKGLGVRFRP
jgi:hypothetical protein